MVSIRVCFCPCLVAILHIGKKKLVRGVIPTCSLILTSLSYCLVQGYRSQSWLGLRYFLALWRAAAGEEETEERINMGRIFHLKMLFLQMIMKYLLNYVH